ncbi:MAG: radical SAM protein [Deltaproteobacteria bacterium]|nr:radical SAM protein [Deltaproteobacteria bacterium]
MNHKTTSVVELVCKRYCSYYKPGQKEEMACQGFKAFHDFIESHPANEYFPQEHNNPLQDQYHHLLHHTLCQYCDFLIDGCDFTDPEHTGQPLPCGGYIAADLVLQQPSAIADPFLESLIPKEAFVALSPNCALKHLEKPYVYDIRNDELYEVDQKGFDFLTKCDGRRLFSELPVDKDFLEICLKEELVVIGPRQSRRHFTLRPSPAPSLRYLELQLTSRCNLKCRHCYLGEPKKAELPLSQVLSVLEEFEEMQGLRMLFSGGEPLLYPDLSALNEALPGYAVRKVLLTNGTLITEENYSDWCHFDEIQFSLDGLKEGHDAIRGPGTFEQTMRGIEAAGRNNMPLSIATMVHRHNLKEFDALSDWIEKLGVVEWNIDVPCATGRLVENPDFSVAPEAGARFLKYATGGSYHGTDEPFACGYHLCTITAEGDILKCGFFKETPLGSLKEGLEISWGRMKPIPLSQLECASCPYLLECKGGCRFRAESPLGKDPVMCALYGSQKHEEQSP